MQSCEGRRKFYRFELLNGSTVVLPDKYFNRFCFSLMCLNTFTYYVDSRQILPTE